MDYELGLLRKLVALNTDSESKENYEACASLIASEAKKLGLKSKIIYADAPDKKPRPNVLVWLDGGAIETLLLVTHYDIVAAGEGWRTVPFKLVQKGSVLYGRGVNDDKGGIAAALGAMRELRRQELKRNIKLVAACDEEIGGDYGISYLVKKHWSEIKGDAALIVDSSTSKLSVGCSGIARGYITLKGKQGHAAYPFRTRNIIHDALPFLLELKDYAAIAEKSISRLDAPREAQRRKLFGRFSITILQAGYKTNIIPPRLKIGFDLRVIPEGNAKREMRKFVSYVKKKMKKYGLKGGIEIKGSNGYCTDSGSAFVREALAAAEKNRGQRLGKVASMGGDDGRHIAVRRIPVVGFGPGGKHCHGANEAIRLRDLLITKETIKDLCRL